MCSFVGRRERKVWTWTVLCRRTRQIVACVVGDRGEETCRKLWEAILRLIVLVIVTVICGQHIVWFFPKDKHQSVGKRKGQLAHIERWHNTVRQRLAVMLARVCHFPSRFTGMSW